MYICGDTLILLNKEGQQIRKMHVSHWTIIATFIITDGPICYKFQKEEKNAFFFIETSECDLSNTEDITTLEELEEENIHFIERMESRGIKCTP